MIFPLVLSNKNTRPIRLYCVGEGDCESFIKMFLLDTVFAECPHADCIECSFRCVSKDIAPTSCGAHIDILGEQLDVCAFCKQLDQPATQDYEDFELSAMLEDVLREESVSMEAEELEKERADFLSGLDVWMDKMDREAAAYTTLPPNEQKTVDGVTFTYFKPFSRIQREEREEFKQFVSNIF